jgi:hypothetical protein
MEYSDIFITVKATNRIRYVAFLIHLSTDLRRLSRID